MAEITAADVGKLRAMTNAGLMDCKKALTEANGDLEAAVDILRTKGKATAAKKAGRAANEGAIAQNISADSRTGVLAEINCETDFVAKNDAFKDFCDAITRKLTENSDASLEEDRVAAVAKLGENIQISRSDRWQMEGNGALASYIHTGAKVGVLVEVGTGSADTVNKDEFKQLVRDITLQIAAGNPQSVDRNGVDQAVLDREKAILAEQMKDKPPQALEKIMTGKMEKYYQTHCLIDQGFVKQNGEISVNEHIASVGKVVGDEINVRRFLRYQVGDSGE